MTSFAAAPNTNIALFQAQATQNDPSASLDKLSSLKNLEEIEATAKEFEAVFVSELLKPMFEGIKTEAPFGGGQGEEVFRSLLLEEYGSLISKTGGIGMADQIKNEIIKLQELANNE